MKRFLLFAFAFLSIFSFSNAQLLPPHKHPAHNVNMQLRALLGSLNRPGTTPKDYLYDMTAHMADSVFYTNMGTDTLKSDTWYQLYWEHYYSAYDTSGLQTDEEIYEGVLNMHPDTIPLGILDYDYYKLKSNALNTPFYFDFDTINTILADKPIRPSEPYTTHNIFAFAPLYHETRLRTVTYKIDMSTIFADAINMDYYTDTSYKIYVDLGDGMGNRQVDPSTTNYFTVTYSGPGPHTITCEIEQDGFKRKTSSGSINTKYTDWVAVTHPDEFEDFEDLRVGTYRACDVPDAERKVVIYLSGFDVADLWARTDREISEIYEQMLKNPRIAQLKNFGYDFIIIDWKNSRKSITANAHDLVKYIDHLKDEIDNEQEFVIIGESMGALIGRYALCYMESNFYMNPTNWPSAHKRDRMHNTRLLISFDGPHQGANVPLSLQHFYEDVASLLFGGSKMHLRFYSKAFNVFLGANSAKEMLIYHVSTRTGLGIYKTYNHHAKRDDMLDAFNYLGNYPQFCKLFTYSNGSLSGEHQLKPPTQTERIANDKLFDFDLSLNYKVLGTVLPLYGAELDLRTNPDGNGKLYQAGIGRYTATIKLTWFGVKFHIGFGSIFSNAEYANTNAYCVNAGGYIGNFEVPSAPLPDYRIGFSRFGFANIFDIYSYADGSGCWTGGLNVSLGTGWSSALLSTSLCSDGMHFNFVPIHSAFDISMAQVSLGHNYEANPVHSLSMSPFHVLSGCSDTDNFLDLIPFTSVPMRNANHTYVRYENRQSFLKAKFPCADCVGINSNIYGHFFNREIGDDELYLNNREQPWDATYQIKKKIFVNVINPKYNDVFGDLPGIYSKTGDYTMSVGGGVNTVFKYGVSGGFIYNSPQTGTWQRDSSDFGPLCCINFGEANKTGPIKHYKETEESKNYLRLYPNPTDKGTVVVNYCFESEGNVEIILLDLTGRKLLSKNLNLSSTLSTFTVLDLEGLKPGMYIIKANKDNTIQTAKLIVQ